MQSTKDYYKTLSVLPNADISVIRAAYDSLSQKYHPDGFHGSRQFANDMMLELNEAYEVLADAAKRSEYDSQRISDAESLVEAPIPETDKSCPPPVAGGPKSGNFGAWRRFWARTLDWAIYQSVAAIFFLIIPVALITNFSFGSWLAAFWLVSLASWCFIEATMLSVFGNTAGKAILGISLHKKDSKSLEFDDLLMRTFDVFLKGYALGVPLINWFTMLAAKSRLEEKGETSWDKKYGFKVTVHPIASTRYALYVVAFLIVAVVHLASVKALEYKMAAQPVEQIAPQAMASSFNKPKFAKASRSDRPVKIVFGQEWYFLKSYIRKDTFDNYGNVIPCVGDKCYSEDFYAKDVALDSYGNKIIIQLVYSPREPDASKATLINKIAVNCSTRQWLPIELCSVDPAGRYSNCSNRSGNNLLLQSGDGIPFSNLEMYEFACNEQ